MGSLDNRLAFEGNGSYKRHFIRAIIVFVICFIVAIIVYSLFLYFDKRKLVKRVERYILNEPSKGTYIDVYDYIEYREIGRTGRIEVIPYRFNTTPSKINITPTIQVIDSKSISLFERIPYGKHYDYHFEDRISNWNLSSIIEGSKKLIASTPYEQQCFSVSKLSGSNGDYWLQMYISRGAIYCTEELINNPRIIYQEALSALIDNSGIRKKFHAFPPHKSFSSHYYYLCVGGPTEKEVFAMGGPNKIYKAFEEEDDWVVFIEKKEGRAVIIENNDEQKHLLFLCLFLGGIAGLMIVIFIPIIEHGWMYSLRNKIWINEDKTVALLFNLPLFGKRRIKILRDNQEEEHQIIFSPDRSLIKTDEGVIYDFVHSDSDFIIFDNTRFHVKQ